MAFIYSYAFILAVLIVATLLEKAGLLRGEGSRKFIHIAVAHWFILAIHTFEGAYAASIVPFSFIILNGLSWRFKLVRAMERTEQDNEGLGTVYYALSLTIITFIAFRYDYLDAGLFAILAMGYGDGLSALTGKHFGKKTVYRKKTYVGSSVMLVFTLAIGFILFPTQIGSVLLIALGATALEMFTKNGFDNLSVPLFIFFLSVVIL